MLNRAKSLKDEQQESEFEQNQEKCSEQSAKDRTFIFVTSQNKYSRHKDKGLAKFYLKFWGKDSESPREMAFPSWN